MAGGLQGDLVALPLLCSSGTNPGPLWGLPRSAVSSRWPPAPSGWRPTALVRLWSRSTASTVPAASAVVNLAIAITVLTVGHSIFEIDSCASSCRNVFTVNLALFRFSKGSIRLEESFLELLCGDVDRQLIHDVPCLSEGIRSDDKNTSFPPLSFDGVPPVRVGLFFRKVRVELPYDFLVAHQAPQVRSKPLTVIFSRYHKDQQSLVSRGNIEALSETVEIL